MFPRVCLSKTVSMIYLYKLVYPPWDFSSNNFSCKPILSQPTPPLSRLPS